MPDPAVPVRGRRWTPSRPGSSAGRVGRAGGRRATPRAPGARPRSPARAGRGRSSELAQPAPVRAAARQARQTASRVASAAARSATRAARVALPRWTRLGRGRRRAGAEHEALAERVGGEAVGAVEPGAGALADGEQARQRGAAVEVDGDASHHVVGGRRDRHRLAGGIESRLAAARRRRSGSGPGRPPAGRAPTWSVPSASMRSRIAAVTASRGASSSVKRSPGGVEQGCALAAHRLGDQQAVEGVPGSASAVG